jgi:repressor LexA
MRQAKPSEPIDRVLTPRRRRIVQVIEDSVRRNGYAPTLHEIGDATGLASTATVAYHLSVLEEKGYLTRQTGLSRTSVVRTPVRPQTGQARRELEEQGVAPVPLVRRIAAGGDQVLADESVEEIIPMPRRLTGEGELLMLRVVGDSMIDAAIADGDWVVVRRDPDVENGDTVAATIKSGTSAGGETTVKTYQERDGHVWLVPRNPGYEPIPGDDAVIVGKVVTVLRRLWTTADGG